MIRVTAIAALCASLAFVFWLGANIYAKNIERDTSNRTQLEIHKHRAEIPDISRVVDGRDVNAYGTTTTDVARATAGEKTLNVWGVRALDNNITFNPIGYDLLASHTFPSPWVTGQVDEPAYNIITNVHQALPPESTVDYSSLKADGPELPRSAHIVETGIAAVTQLNPGTLTITDSTAARDVSTKILTTNDFNGAICPSCYGV